MSTINDVTLTNNFGEETQNQIVNGKGIVQLMRCTVTYAQLNAAGSGVALALPLAKTIPNKAIIKQVYYNVTTTFADNGTSGDADSSTISLGANSAVDLKAAIAISNGANPWDVGIGAGIPINTAASMVKCTAARVPTVTWNDGSGDSTALTAGEMNVYIEYVEGT